MRQLVSCLLGLGLVGAVLAGGCATEGDLPDGAAHPDGWVSLHAGEPVEGCTVCHGADYRGSGRAPDCLTCHLEGPPFRAHPADWDDVLADHRGFARAWSWTGCAAAACHGADLRGSSLSGAPGCFESSCHEAGPPAPHPASYSAPEAHGRAARANLRECAGCHASHGNRFDGGFVADHAILGRPGGDCSGCHPDAGAHPIGWVREDAGDGYLETHRGTPPAAMDTGCALCHAVEAAGASPQPEAPGCFSATFTSAQGESVGCHGDGPGAVSHQLPFSAPELHGPGAVEDLTRCQSCHGEPGTRSFSGGFVGVGCSECHAKAGAHPARWQGANDPDPTYAASHRIVGRDGLEACGLCHGTTTTAPSPEPEAPSCFAPFSAETASACHPAGPGAAYRHPEGWENDHVAVSRIGVGSCLAECHADVLNEGVLQPGTPPGCADCHLGGAATDERLVHPDGDPIGARFGRLPGEDLEAHGDFVNDRGGDATSCTLSYCHGPTLEGGRAPRNGSWGDGWSCFACHDKVWNNP
ncbi:MULTISPECIES: hypothetical protein [Deferrisoma]